MDLNHLPIIDWELALKATNNKKELAEEILQLFIKGLPKDVLKIKKLHHEQQYDELLKYTHKLHGAICYCGLPRLKKVVMRMETELKSEIYANLSTLIDHFAAEVSLLLEYHPHSQAKVSALKTSK
jgi:HPt (histidine-containing phosphotransfer) domain-containing protein